MSSGQESRDKFERWVAEREQLGDHENWVFRGGLNKTKIAKACGFASAQPFNGDFNPELRKRAKAVEEDWEARGLLSPKTGAPRGSKAVSAASREVADRRADKDFDDAQARIKQLEERNATLQAEITQLRVQYRQIDEHLGLTGRLLPP